MRKYAIGFALILSLIIIAIVLRFRSIAISAPNESISSIREREGIPVRTSLPIVESKEDFIELSGSVEAIREATVNARIGEEITSSSLKLGSFFPQNTVVAELRKDSVSARYHLAQAGVMQARAALEKARNGARPEEIKQAKSVVTALKARHEQAEMEYNRMVRLQKANAISDQKSEQIRSAYDTAAAQLAEAQHRLKLLESGTRPEDLKAAEAMSAQAEANLELAKIELDNTMIRMPIAGFISRIYKKQGEETERGKPVFEIVDLDEVFLVVDVPETEIGRLSKGLSSECMRYDADNASLPGHIDEIAPKADPVSRTFEVKIRTFNSKHVFKPGMIAKVKIITTARRPVMMIPQEAVVHGNGNPGVYIVTGNKAEFREIRAISRQNELVEIISGLLPKDPVVVSGQADLKEGMKVKPEGEQR